ncbi:cell division protein ZapE [Halomonas sp. MCCC 1A17488]|uniref:Cell division protein ZapE n=1 Tax=Billgrantia sulfidoxydans TaxID=2733484 RepID=A0ABX7W7K8_9GAMM|nr:MULTISPECIES: cell division protein ZapE [Halomonas]MCE8017793.1 cell division protein ZapE [Halomonas sp. MCCC 1A17488]MCG3241126.1 cell division protein ZapE [Halomonas sp. MCCC 1A17488]QPP48981.1 AFG1 family ATPase [Halomonas sp. SS10-MC5]QTP56298.1 cell division protein ZapE [Halomonas sulfidoxydans]
MTAASPLGLYREAVERHGFAPDEAQRAAAARLEVCFQALHDAGATKGRGAVPGVYLWGPVGRGKTWLMDGFHRHLGVPARRLHFHHFMRWVHQRQFQLGGTVDPLAALARELASEVRVLCLDELFVSDIADAMLLGRLLQALFEHGVVLVCTSNQAPSQLYADGFNRERFLPAIAAIEHHMEVVELDGGYDHRLHPGQAWRRYWVAEPGEPSKLGAVFERLSEGQTTRHEPIELGHRRIAVERRSGRVVWCRYAELCEQPLAALDFIALADEFDHVLLSEVPRLSDAASAGRIARGTEDGAERIEAGERELPPLSRRDDGVRRFIALVDECYDRRVPLHIEAEVAMEELYPHGYLSFAFRRTLSRLQEMQLARFGCGA